MPPVNGQVPVWDDQLDPPFKWDNAPAGTPATTITNETTWGITPAVGTSTNYAREDHTHGSPTQPQGGGTPSDTVTEETSFGASSAADSASSYSRGDHTHGTPTNPVAAHEGAYSHALLHANTLDHGNENDPTSGQKAALAGTSGTPADANRYVTNDDSRNANARTPTAHTHGGGDITSGTLDGDRLPAMSATKLGGVPKTGNPSGLFLRDDGTFAAAGGGSNPIKIPLVLNQTTPSTVPVLAGGLAFNKTTYSLTTIKFRAVGSVTDANYTGTLKLYEDAVLMATLTFSSTSMTIQESAALSLAASEKYLEVQMYVSNIAASAIVAAAWLEITP